MIGFSVWWFAVLALCLSFWLSWAKKGIATSDASKEALTYTYTTAILIDIDQCGLRTLIPSPSSSLVFMLPSRDAKEEGRLTTVDSVMLFILRSRLLAPLCVNFCFLGHVRQPSGSFFMSEIVFPDLMDEGSQYKKEKEGSSTELLAAASCRCTRSASCKSHVCRTLWCVTPQPEWEGGWLNQ